MDEPIQDPIEEAVSQLQEGLSEYEDTFAKVCQGALELDEYTHYTDIADKVNCSENAAKKYLKRLKTLGVVEGGSSYYLAYRRNRSYLEWIWANYLAESLSEETLGERVDYLEKRDKDYQKQFDRASPAGIPLIANENPSSRNIRGGREWRHIRRQLQIHEFAYYLHQSDGRLTTV